MSKSTLVIIAVVLFAGWTVAVWFGGRGYEKGKTKIQTHDSVLVTILSQTDSVPFPVTLWKYDTTFVDSSRPVIDSTFYTDGRTSVKYQVQGKDTTADSTSLTYHAEFRDKQFQNFRFSLSPIRVKYSENVRVETVQQEFMGGFGVEWIQEIRGNGFVKGTAYVPVNSWLNLTPSVGIGSKAGVGIGCQVWW